MSLYDVIVIGGGFAGLSAAMQLARGRRKVAVIDAGQPRNRFAAASHGFFAQDGKPPLQMLKEARDMVLAYPSITFIRDEARAAKALPAGGFEVELACGQPLQAAKLILAFGLTDLLPELPGAAERWGASLLHCPYCHGYEFADQPLGVLSVGARSAHQAMLIAEWGPTTFFLDGGPMPDAETLEKLSRRSVAIEPAPLAALEGPIPHLEAVRLADGRAIPVVALYVATGTRLNSPIAEQLGCALDDGPFGPVILADAERLTTVPGVYAAGDIARAPHNATWASADGVTAGAAAHRALVFG